VRTLAFLVAVSLSSACAGSSARVTTQSQAPSFRVRTLAVAAPRGAKGKDADLSRALVRRLEEGGFHAAALEDSDSVLAGSALGLDIASNPRVLAEVRSATGADAIVFLTLDPGWRVLDVAVLNLANGEPILRATARPRGAVFQTAEEAASAAAEVLSALSPDKARAAAAAGAEMDEIPVP
jgi:hypothetical protein